MAWIEVLAQDALPEGSREVVKVEDRSILLIHHQGQLYAVSNSCPHLKLPLKKGKLTEDCAIVCPFHRSAFDLKTGDVKNWTPFPPVVGQVLGMVSKEKTLPVFPTRIENGKIWVDVN
ncbi:MAG TPA: Rieske (2Fe-2S) protein [Oscillatoriales cyanobacterium M59_W2019_021]|nr:MAG: Rieske (2Fe-2S) protein [Cyanobacteria bacterium J055]HIK32828.1 Rieske (2Fe-2S) protein [Oscillatoriales cyanobacterium M4454_W2019_049]HIK51813.1 Rieske (2Fe-2S) protein [Oscillatoriales cyanobacterium M59_W2019_021]